MNRLTILALVAICIAAVCGFTAAKADDLPHPTAKSVTVKLSENEIGTQIITIGDRRYAVVNDFVKGSEVPANPLPAAYHDKVAIVVYETGIADGHPFVRVFWSCYKTTGKTTRAMQLK